MIWLYEIRLAALFLDAVFLSVRPEGPKEGVLVAWGFTESDEGVLVVADGAPGLIKAVEQCWPASDRQHCAVHRVRNLLAKLPERERERVRSAYWQALDDATGERDGKQRLGALVDELDGAGLTAAAKCLADDLDALVVHLRYPTRHRRRWRSTECHEGGPPWSKLSDWSAAQPAKGGPGVQYLGIDWAYRRAAWCARSEGGAILDEGFVPADEDGLAKLVLSVGPDVHACVEMMSGAVWVRDRLQSAGWHVEVADARKVKGLAPLACKTDKVDARVLAELCRRDLVPAVWLPSLDDRALRERLKRRMHLVRMRTMARNRIHGVLTQWGLKISVTRLRRPDGLALLEARGVPEVWRRSVAEALAVIDWLDERLAPLERELGPLAPADARVVLLETIPGIGPLLGLTMATEIGDIARFPSARKLIGYAGLAPKIKQSGQSSRTGPLSKAGSKMLRWAAVEAAQQAWRETNPWHELYRDVAKRQGKTNAGKAAVARKVLIAAWHVLSREQPFKPCRPRGGADPVPASSHFHLAA